ncbi:MAG TPA: pyrroline-5-carboxylate reductase [Acidobacteriaceae bacterium]|jgi:pyrroline-5-carboxylate reductase|nr:pyrroline-5-carboxylate reductase [Acidobacteriaceae bacterium]
MSSQVRKTHTAKNAQTEEAQSGALRIAVLGAGKMGGILVEAFLRSGLFTADRIAATVAHDLRAQALSEKLGFRITTDNRRAVKDADIVLLAVKPTQVVELVREITPTLKRSALLISIAASVKTSAIEDAAGASRAVIRAMPNTPAMLAAGITALCRGRFATDDQLALAQKIFTTVGRTVVVDERHMDAVTGLSGSGPAFLYIILEALAEAGVNVGLPRETATQLAAQTAYGAARMVLETGSHPALLKDEVTTPAGCTVDGILELEEGGLRVTLIKAVKRATERARELAGS